MAASRSATKDRVSVQLQKAARHSGNIANFFTRSDASVSEVVVVDSDAESGEPQAAASANEPAAASVSAPQAASPTPSAASSIHSIPQRAASASSTASTELQTMNVRVALAHTTKKRKENAEAAVQLALEMFQSDQPDAAAAATSTDTPPAKRKLSVSYRSLSPSQDLFGHNRIVKWGVDHPWLCKDENGFYCSWCREANGACNSDLNFVKNSLPFDDCTSNKVTRHKETAFHIKHSTDERTKNRRALVAAVQKGQADYNPFLLTLFRAAYFVCRGKLGNRKSFAAVLTLLSQNHCPTLSLEQRYHTPHAAHEMQMVMSDWLKEEQLAAVALSPCFGISCDEATDVSTSKQLIVYIRYFKKNGARWAPVTEFLALLEVEDGTAEELTSSLTSLLHKLKLLEIPTRFVGLATDGASVMMGIHNGLGVKLQEKVAPYLHTTHCIAHRVSLACKDARFVDNYMEEYEATLSLLHCWFSRSSVRSAGLLDFQKQLGGSILKLIQLSRTRWLCIQHCAARVEKVWEALFNYFKQQSDLSEDAAFIFRRLCSFQFISTSLFLAACLEPVDRLVKSFQSDVSQPTHTSIGRQVSETLAAVAAFRVTAVGQSLEVSGMVISRLQALFLEVESIFPQPMDLSDSEARPVEPAPVASATPRIRKPTEKAAAASAAASTAPVVPRPPVKSKAAERVPFTFLNVSSPLLSVSEEEVQQQRNNFHAFATGIDENLKRRFPQGQNSANFLILDPTLSVFKSVIQVDSEGKDSHFEKGFGAKQIEVLSRVYGQSNTRLNGSKYGEFIFNGKPLLPLLNGEELRSELYGYLSILIEGGYCRMTHKTALDIWSELLQSLDVRARIPNFCKLAQIVYCIPVSSVHCERGFSVMKAIKHETTNRMSAETLDVRMRIVELGRSADVMESLHFFHQSTHMWRHKLDRRPMEIGKWNEAMV